MRVASTVAIADNVLSLAAGAGVSDDDATLGAAVTAATRDVLDLCLRACGRDDVALLLDDSFDLIDDDDDDDDDDDAGTVADDDAVAELGLLDGATVGAAVVAAEAVAAFVDKVRATASTGGASRDCAFNVSSHACISSSLSLGD